MILTNKYYNFIEGDLLDPILLGSHLSDIDIVFHLAANADIRGGLSNPGKDLEQNTIVTFNVLEAMRHAGVFRIVFASSAAALGEPTIFPTPEDCPVPIQTSLYGASKMACEGLISAYCEGYQFEGYAFRFASLLGPRYPHGHVFDFVKQLLRDRNNLVVLGNGGQKKSYLHIDDCIEALIKICIVNRTALNVKHNFQVYHLGAPSYCQVSESVSWICSELGLEPKIHFGDSDRGWVGDNPFVYLDISKAQAAGWQPAYGIEDSIKITTRWLANNPWIFDR